MEIFKMAEGKTMIIKVSGRIDTTTAPELDKTIKNSIENTSELILDFENLDYISSAGLRVILSAQKTMNQQGGKMKVTNVNEIVAEVFEITGFADILNIE